MGNKSSKTAKIHQDDHFTFHYEDGSYVGEAKHSLPHGLGKYYYNSGEQYTGNFEQGIFSGYGSYYDSYGYLVYCGEWKDGTYHGVGSYYQDGSLWYWGEWMLGEARGNGILYNKDGGVEYEGHMPLPQLPIAPPPQCVPTAPPLDYMVIPVKN